MTKHIQEHNRAIFNTEKLTTGVVVETFLHLVGAQIALSFVVLVFLYLTKRRYPCS